MNIDGEKKGGNGEKIPPQLRDWKFCKIENRGKNPFEPGWQENGYSWDDPELLNWIKRGGNYGVVGGNGHVVVDADAQELQNAIERDLPETFTVRTPGHFGKHYYYSCELKKPMRLNDRDGRNIGDVQVRGKCVVGPGCIHPNGGSYEIIDESPVARITEEQLREALRGFINERDIYECAKEVAGEEGSLQRREGIHEINIIDVVPTVGLRPSGGELFGPHPVHGSETGRNFWVNPVKNVWHCFRHDSGGGPWSWLAVEAGIIDCSEALPGRLKGETFKKLVEYTRDRGIIEGSKNSRRNTAEKYFEDKRFIPKYLGDEILGEYVVRTIEGSEEPMIYEDCIYVPAESKLKTICVEKLEKESRTHRVSETLNYIKARTFVSPGIFEQEPYLVCLENGVLDLRTNELKDFSPDFNLLNRIPIIYDPSAQCPKISEFFGQIVEKEDVPLIEELFGYCLLREYPIQKAFMLVGDGANGKSTLEELLTVFLGPQNVSHIPLQSLDMDRFQKAELFGKLANAYADIPSSALTRTGTFKALVGGDRVTAQKKFRDPFSFKNYAKLVFSCNKVPEVGDDSTAFFRRWVILNFPFKFEGDRDDKNIMEKLTKKEELSGLFNLAVKGLERLLRNGGFSRTPSTDEVRRTWQRMASSVSCFREDMLVVDSDKWVTKEEMYLRYVGYCRKEKIPAVAKNTFGTKLPEYIKRFMKDGRGSPMAERGSGGE